MLKTATLAFLDFSEQQQKIFSSLLFLSGRNLNQIWDIVTKDLAQVILVCSKEPISETQWDEIQLAYPQAILVAYSMNLISLQTPWKLLTKETALTNRAELITLLNKVTQHKSKQKSKEIKVKESPLIKETLEQKPNISPQETINDNLFLPENYFLSLVQMSIKTGYIYRCRIEDDIVIYLLPQQNCYFCSTEIIDLKKIFLTSPKKIKVRKMLETELKQQINGLKTKALNDLLWYATVTASQGRFMVNHQPDDNVSLMSWPDISLISENKNYLEIAIFMSHNITNLIDISKNTQKNLNDVIDFYNACYILGLISIPESNSLLNNSKELPGNPINEKVQLKIVA